ncbi:MAG TPA: hypothetical protein VFY68_08760 [Nitrososphaeraceae archaeon]|nr:hypothetical protein [Nitrososphaeraceae archaeon]
MLIVVEMMVKCTQRNIATTTLVTLDLYNITKRRTKERKSVLLYGKKLRNYL